MFYLDNWYKEWRNYFQLSNFIYLLRLFYKIHPNPLSCKFFFSAENDTMCPCSCDYMDKIEYWKNKSNEYANKTLIEIYNELLPQLEATKKALEEDKTQLSSYQAKKTSAADSRPSAKQVGSTFGIIFISIFLGLVIAFDLSSYKRHLRTIRFCRRRLWFIQVHQYTHGWYFSAPWIFFSLFYCWKDDKTACCLLPFFFSLENQNWLCNRL